jgi:hypothetical protein
MVSWCFVVSIVADKLEDWLFRGKNIDTPGAIDLPARQSQAIFPQRTGCDAIAIKSQLNVGEGKKYERRCLKASQKLCRLSLVLQ